jgi:peroxiredoxin
VPYDPGVLVQPGQRAPSFRLDNLAGELVVDPWTEGRLVLAFFKVTCPVCQMVAPKVQALAGAGVPVVAIGQDPAPKLAVYAERFGQRVPTLSEPPPYRVADAFGVSAVPTLVVVDGDGMIEDTVPSWDREGWNRVAAAFGGGPVSEPGDGLPPFRPG